MRALLVICALASTAFVANGWIVGNTCTTSADCSDANSFCKSMQGCQNTMKCVCKFGYVWNGDISTNGNGRCIHKNYLQTGLACQFNAECAGTITLDPLDYSTVAWGLGHQCISNKCSCITNYEPISSTTPYGWIMHRCMPTTTTSTTTTTTTPTTTTSTTSTTTTSTTSTSTTTPTTTTTTTPTTTTTTTPTTTTTTSTTTTTIPLRIWGQKCWDNTNGYTSTICDPGKNLKCLTSDTCAPDTTTYYCYCPNGWKNDGSGGCKKVELGDSCNVTSHCTYLGNLAYCNDDGVCDVAQPNASARVGVMCDKTATTSCNDTNAVCRPHDACEMYDMCVCKWGYIFNGYKCLPYGALKVGAACATNWDCMYQTRRDPRDFSMVWMNKILMHVCNTGNGKCACDSAYDPVEAKYYDISTNIGKYNISYDQCVFRTTTTSTSSTSTTTSTTSTTSTSTSTSTTTSTTSTTTTPTTTTTTTTPTTTTTTSTTTTLPACTTGYERRVDGVCRKYLVWGDTCWNVTWTAGNMAGYFDSTIYCDPARTLVCRDVDQCSMVGNSIRSCSCQVGWKRDGSGCKKIEMGDVCNTTLYCNTYLDAGFCGDDGKCANRLPVGGNNGGGDGGGNGGKNAGIRVDTCVSPLFILLVLLVPFFS